MSLEYCYSSFLLISICILYLFSPLTFSLYVSLGLKWVSCRQHIDGSCFCIHSASLCLLLGALNLFTFKVIKCQWLNAPIKRHRVADLIKTKTSAYKTLTSELNTQQTKSEGMEKVFHSDGNQFTSMDRSSRRKINKEKVVLNYTIDWLDLILI